VYVDDKSGGSSLQIGEIKYVEDAPPPPGKVDTKWAKVWRFKRATNAR